MALVCGVTWGQSARPWGYETRVDVTDSDTGTVYNEVMVFPAAPTHAELTFALGGVVARLSAALVPPPAEYSITNDDGTVTTI